MSSRSPSQRFDDKRDGQRSEKPSDGKYGHSDGPEEGGCLRSNGLPVSLDPCLIVEGLNVLQHKRGIGESHISNVWYFQDVLNSTKF